MENVLFLHHFEEMWEDGLKSFDTNMEDITNKVIDFLMDKGDIDTVFITKMESVNPEESHHLLLEYCENNDINVVFQEYAYAMYRDLEMHDEDDEDYDPDNVPYPMEKLDKTWTYGNREHHDKETDVLDIEEFHYELKNVNKLYLAGAFEGECINDQETILDAIDAEYEKIDGLVVGTYVDYEFKALNKIRNQLTEELDEIATILKDNFENVEAEDMKIENPELFEEVLDKIENFINDNNEYLNIIGFSLDVEHYILEQALEAEKYDEFDSFKEEMLDDLEEIKETNNLKIDIENEFYQNGLFDLNKKELNLSKTFNIEINDWVLYFNSNEDVEILEAEEKGFKENCIPVVFKVKEVFEDIYKADLNDVDMDDEIIIYKDSLYLSDEQEACSTLLNNGFKGLLIKKDTNDKLIVIDNDLEIENFEVKAKVNNEWTDYMNPNSLIKKLTESNKRKSRQKFN